MGEVVTGRFPARRRRPDAPPPAAATSTTAQILDLLREMTEAQAETTALVAVLLAQRRERPTRGRA